VHNIEEMVHNVERHGDDDQYNNGKLFQLKASNGWSDYSFNDLLTLLSDTLPHGNIVPETIYEVKQIIYSLSLEVKKIHACKNDCILYHGPSMKTLRNIVFVDSIDSIIEKTTVITRTPTEIEENAGLKRCFDIFLSFLI
jgi:hypothetical protein